MFKVCIGEEGLEAVTVEMKVFGEAREDSGCQSLQG